MVATTRNCQLITRLVCRDPKTDVLVAASWDSNSTTFFCFTFSGLLQAALACSLIGSCVHWSDLLSCCKELSCLVMWSLTSIPDNSKMYPLSEKQITLKYLYSGFPILTCSGLATSILLEIHQWHAAPLLQSQSSKALQYITPLLKQLHPMAKAAWHRKK